LIEHTRKPSRIGFWASFKLVARDTRQFSSLLLLLLLLLFFSLLIVVGLFQLSYLLLRLVFIFQ
jgi:hypothetical protein